MPDIPFPASSAPGERAGEGEGRLVNVYAEKRGDRLYWLRGPGLSLWSTIADGPVRGLLDVDPKLYVVYQGGAARLGSGGTVEAVLGAIGGTDRVSMARNNRVGANSPDIVAVRASGGAWTLNTGAVAVYPSTPWTGDVIDVAPLQGYFVFVQADGTIWASDLNHTDVDALSFARAESSPDGLLRGITSANTFYAMGSETIEPWLNHGTSPFPLRPATSVMPVGLLAAGAVAGVGAGWDHPPLFVAHDGTVRVLDGYTTRIVSTPAVEKFIARSNRDSLEATAFVTRGHPMWVISSDEPGTWVYDLSTEAWHERRTGSGSRWAAQFAIRFNHKWLAGERGSDNIVQIEDGALTDNGEGIEVVIESGPMREFPARFRIPSAFFDFTEMAGGSTLDVSWSLDGGNVWLGPLERSLSDAEKWPIRVNMLGLSTHHGIRFRLETEASGKFTFQGGSVPFPEPRLP